jgi:ribosomal protein L31E
MPCTLIRVYILLFSAAEWGAGWVRAPEGWNAVRNLLHESFPTRDEIWVGDRVPETVWETVDEGVSFNWPETRQQLNTRSILRLE